MFPSPALAIDSATKTYVNMLSEVLHAEFAGAGITVTLLAPGPVPTEFQEVAGTAGRNPLPKAFHVDVVPCAEEAIAALKTGQARRIPGAAVRATMLSVESLPKAVSLALALRWAKRLRA